MDTNTPQVAAFDRQCHALAHLFVAGELEFQEAVDRLHDNAKSWGVVELLGEDEVTRRIGEAFPPCDNDELDRRAIEPEPEPAAPVDPTDAEIERLAKLSAVKYERERNDFAKRTGIRASILDKLVKAKRTESEPAGQGRALEFPKVEPWATDVNGGELLDEVVRTICRYVVLPDGIAETVALWAFHTHCFDCFGHSPRLGVMSPEKGCGKTTLLDVVSHLVARPLPTSSATVAAIFRVVEMSKPTLLIDEADTFLRDNEELRGLLNAGHRKGGGVLRTVGEDHEPRTFSSWAPCAIALIGKLPDTLEDRSVICSLRRRKQDETVESFRGDRAEHLHVLARKMAKWAADHEVSLRAADPDVCELQNRVADNWRPLFAVADAAGNAWPSRAREIATAATSTRSEQSFRVQLLGDIREAFEIRGADRLSSEDLTEYLVGLEGRPWAEWKHGRPLTKASLARLLSPFGIPAIVIRVGSQTPRGYRFVDFCDAFERYLPSQSATTQQ
jgi:putative DNA primase/helicase